MRSRSAVEVAGVALGAVAEGIWTGALAAALTAGSWVAATLFATLVVLAAAAVARRLLAGASREGVARLLALTIIIVATAALLVAGRAWAHPLLVWVVVRDFAYSAGLVLLGVYLGRARPLPETAVRRAARGFVLLCVVLVGAAIAGYAPAWASAAVVAALVVGGLLVAVVRYQALTELVDPAARMPVWPWLLAVTGAVLGVIAVGALLSQLLGVDALRAALGVLADVLRYVLDGLAYLIGYAGAAVIRAISWLLAALHIHGRDASELPHLRRKFPELKPRDTSGTRIWNLTQIVFTVAGVVAVVGLSLALVALALRRFRRGQPEEAGVVEERESLGSLRSAAGELAARLGRRLRRRLEGLRRHDQLTPAEVVRRRYLDLERRLTRGGRLRAPGTTVRDYLMEAAAAAATVTAAAAPEDQAAGPEEEVPPLSAAADLAAVYELARYSAHALDRAQADRFSALARGFGT